MRKILFRVWDKTRKRMYTGNEVSAIYHSGIIMIIVDNDSWMLVPKNYVLMQYTGLKDRAWHKIFEGDIIQNKHSHIGVVDWHNDIGAWAWDHGINWGEIDSKGVYIIGNIYENPALDRLRRVII